MVQNGPKLHFKHLIWTPPQAWKFTHFILTLPYCSKQTWEMIWCSFNSMTSICFCLCQCNALSLLYIICRLIKKYIFCICILLGKKMILNWKDRQINSSFFISNCKLHILFTLILLIIAVKKAQIFCQFLSRGCNSVISSSILEISVPIRLKYSIQKKFTAPDGGFGKYVDLRQP